MVKTNSVSCCKGGCDFPAQEDEREVPDCDASADAKRFVLDDPIAIVFYRVCFPLDLVRETCINCSRKLMSMVLQLPKEAKTFVERTHIETYLRKWAKPCLA
jgi:hypothetical protein